MCEVLKQLIYLVESTKFEEAYNLRKVTEGIKQFWCALYVKYHIDRATLQKSVYRHILLFTKKLRNHTFHYITFYLAGDTFISHFSQLLDLFNWWDPLF